MKDGRFGFVKLWREMRDPYRPEKHYMRGPGPRSGGGKSAASEDRSTETTRRADGGTARG